MVIFKLLNFLCGYYELASDGRASNETINIILKNKLDYWKLKKREDGGIEFSMLKSEYKKFTALNGKAEIKKERGLPEILKRYRKRIGIPIGLIICAILLKLSTLYIWEVEVTGNSHVSDAEIIEGLEKLGCSVGTYIPSVDFYGICHEYILENEAISWVSVNMVGTTAQVEVIERYSKKPAEGEGGNGTPTNIIAARDGIIERVETYGGMTSCKAGEAVKKGQLLVSGVLDIGHEDEGKFILVRSRGSIYAETERTLEVSVPLNSTKKVYSGRENVYKYIKFFGKMIKVKENSSILEGNCDIIEKKRRIILFEGSKFFDGVALPLTVINGYREIYAEKEITLTQDEALAAARLLMTELFVKELGDAEILQRRASENMRIGENGEELVLTWDIVCIENIAEEVPIGLS